jgi:putative hydrolase of the HAD superfamily
MTSPLRAALFDAVGTLLHLREPVGVTYARLTGRGEAARLQAAFSAALRGRAPMVFPALPRAAVDAAERDWWQALVRDVFAAAGSAVRAGDFDVLWRHYGSAAAWTVAPGAAALLARCRADGLRTGLVSNFDHRLPAILDELELAPLFEVVVLPADAAAAKPDGRIFALALQRLGVRAAEAVYIGDDAHDDIAGATAAGLRAIDVATVADLRQLRL